MLMLTFTFYKLQLLSHQMIVKVLKIKTMHGITIRNDVKMELAKERKEMRELGSEHILITHSSDEFIVC